MASAGSHPTLPPGAIVAGKLRVVRTIGSGGMGVVYEVEHELTRHRRALKVIHAHIAQHPGIYERFLREASAAARIGNMHVAETYDAGRLESGEPYLLMELVDGETLDHRLLREGPLSPGEIADLVHQACEGLQAAHDAGIVHRDLNPENLMVTLREGAPFVKILDFGISKFDTERTGSLGITVAGAVMGTPYYMSPEQVRGVSQVDARTDVYAMGVILYECACGVRPFEAATVEALAVLIHIGRPTLLADRRPSLPTEFCAIVHRAMSLDPGDRFEGARALGEALAPLRVRTVRTPISSAPPRAVVRGSGRPPSPSGGGPASSIPPSTDGALASTMGSGSPRARRPTSPWMRIGAGTGFVVAVVGAVFVGRFAQGPSRPASSLAGTIADAAAKSPSVVVTPLRVAAPAATGELAAGAAGRDGGIIMSLTPTVRSSSPIPVPTATPTAKSRVDQTGLAAENPFK
jgi:serine/threonine protein kinase